MTIVRPTTIDTSLAIRYTLETSQEALIDRLYGVRVCDHGFQHDRCGHRNLGGQRGCKAKLGPQDTIRELRGGECATLLIEANDRQPRTRARELIDLLAPSLVDMDM